MFDFAICLHLSFLKIRAIYGFKIIVLSNMLTTIACKILSLSMI